MSEIDLKTWLVNQSIPQIFNKKGKKEISITTEDLNESIQHYLTFHGGNGKKNKILYKIPINEDGVLDAIYNKKIELEEPNSYPNIFVDERNSIGWGEDTLNSNADLIITLSPLDKMAWMALNEGNVITLPLNWQFDDGFFEALKARVNLNQVPNIYISFPEIEDKEALEESIAEKLSGANLKFIELSSLNTIKELNLTTLFEIFPKVIELDLKSEDIVTTLKAYSRKENIVGLYTLDQVDSLIDSIYLNGVKKGESTGWDEVDELYRPKLSYVSLVYGIPSHGKSTFVKCLSLNLARTAFWKTLFLAFEDGAIEKFYHEMIEKDLGSSTPFFGEHNRSKEALNNKAYIQSKEFVRNNIFLYRPTSEHYTAEDFFDALMESLKQVVKAYGIKQIVLDPWNQIVENRRENQSEANYLCEKLAAINRFAQEMNVHVIIVTHPRVMPREEQGEYKVPTPYDLSGGAHWYNQTAACICIYRHEIPQNDDLDRITHVVVQKIKDRSLGSLGRAFLYTTPRSETLRSDNFQAGQYKQYLKNRKEGKAQTQTKLTDFINNASSRLTPNNGTMPFKLNKQTTDPTDLPF